MTQQLSRPTDEEGASPVSAHDEALRRRRRGIYVLVGVCCGFFVVAIGASYIAAFAHGYGTGFGDGRQLTDRIPPLGGTGAWGDTGILAGALAIDVLILAVWYFAASRMDAPGVDDPVAPDEHEVDLNDDASWYVVHVPGLTKSLMFVAWFCLVAIVIGVSAIIPVVTIRFGWVL